NDPIRDARIFGILEIYSTFFYWPTFTTDIDFETLDIDNGDNYFVFLEFDFMDIDDVIPFGPIYFWGAWYIDIDNYGYDVKEFWLDDDHKWTPTPNPTNTPSNTPTSTPSSYEPGDLVSNDYIVGNVRYIPVTGSEGFLQGSPEDEPCNVNNEYPQFTHILTRNLAVMETEVTRQMWSDLQSVRPDLPDDPTVVQYGVGANNPVQNITWKESILFSNLLSVVNGYNRCYYTDSEYTIPIDVTNYEVDPVYCNFDADGYRLPTEGEWEYFCRAGTTGAFFCPESNYLPYICYSCDPLDWLEPNSNCELWKHVLFCANSADKSEPVGSKLSNPWNLKDIGTIHITNPGPTNKTPVKKNIKR
ncbi:SUMF1/EgtB/PvdO family nonheme iron enzyme, partial [bacterium]|nr:SUMF1/EgtB/PvdO family nonheme iron enzyme [bacterium]